MSWIDHAIWWHVYPLGFCDAPIREAAPAPGPRLRRLVAWLDYAVDLGASGLLLGPIFASQTHGYDTTDHFQIDPRLGREADFDDLVTQCHARGLRLVLDGVFSHVSEHHPELSRALREGPGSPAAALFDIDWAAPGGPVPHVFEGHGSLARLNHSAPATREYTQRVLEYWLERGIDGWRLDAAYSVAPDFWAAVLPPVKQRFPESWVLGEVIHGDYSAFVAESHVDSVTQYELWKAIWSSLNDRNFFELEWALQRHNQFLASFTPNTFIGNHDVTRIASMVGQDAAVVALTILLTVGGIPSIYAGDEQGFTGIKEERVGGDDDVRPPFPDDPTGLAPWGQPILRAHQGLIGVRRRHPWLVNATTEQLSLDNTRYTYRTTAADGSSHLDVTLDISGVPTASVSDAAGNVLWRH